MDSGLDAPGLASLGPAASPRNDELGRWRTAARGVIYPQMASLLSTFILPAAAGAVALVLLLGLINMMRGGSPNTSQKLMRWRVLLQFVAIIIAMLAVWAMGR
ncbi:hypothetical protein ACVIIV_002287 [Bradyrhizobium sp. USDA 4354]